MAQREIETTEREYLLKILDLKGWDFLCFTRERVTVQDVWEAVAKQYPDKDDLVVHHHGHRVFVQREGRDG